jgi:serine/threonine-protein kinase
VPSTGNAIAVLPFENIGGDTADAYFADGMAEELATALARVPGLRVLSRSSVTPVQQRASTVSEIGRILNVNAVLEGTVRRDGDRTRVNARLTSVADGHLIWSDRYDRGRGDVFALQDEISGAIVRALQSQLGTPRPAEGAGSNPAEARGTADPEAYDLYMRGQFLLRRRGPGVRLSARQFEQAIARDSAFGRAYAGLAAALELHPYFTAVPARDVFVPAMQAARRALAVDSTLAEAHTALALAHQHAWEWSAAEREFREALADDPDDAATRHQYARFLIHTSRVRDGLDQLRTAQALDPFSAVISSWVGYALYMSGALDSAIAEGRRALELDPTVAPAIAFAAFANVKAGNRGEARRLAETLRGAGPIWEGARAYTLGAIADTDAARAAIASLSAITPRPWMAGTAIALGYLGMGELDRALDALQRATDDREIWPSFFPVPDPLFDPVRRHPRFVALLKKVGL